MMKENHDNSYCVQSLLFPIILTLHDLYAGHKYYYNTKTHVSQWERPDSSLQVSLQHSDIIVPRSIPDAKQDDQLAQQNICMGCGVCGVGIVQMSGYCSRCTGYMIIPFVHWQSRLSLLFC